MNRSRLSSQQGIALISIMVVVVIATVLAVQMTNEQRLVIGRTATQVDVIQARQYAFGGEELARQILYRDFQEQPTKDYPGEAWASPELSFSFENGSVDIVIEDLQGRINVNALAVSDNRGGQGTEDPLDASAVLQRLVTLGGFDVALAERIKDWIDSDDSQGPLGAEDFDYLGLTPPYRTADHAMTNLSELRLILEITPEALDFLAPNLAALPTATPLVNVNTATPAVLAALVPELTFEAAEMLTSSEGRQVGYDSVAQFLQEPVLAGSGLSATGLGVQSSFFEVQVSARYLDRVVYLTSVIRRNPADGVMEVVYRDMNKNLRPLLVAADG